jgi:hypothetical protein
MPKPTFIIPGASRSGTTTLWSIIRRHPDACTPKEKEIRFFDRDENYNRGLEYYESRFEKCKGSKEIGEVSPPYWYKGITFNEDREYRYSEEDAPLRIKKAYPDIKIIFTFRNPVDRMFSQFWKNVRQGREKKRSVMEAVKEEMDGDRSYKETPTCWVYKNSYAKHFKRWISLFGKDNIKVLIFEDWISKKESALKSVFSFLELKENPDIEYSSEKNVSKTPFSYVISDIRREYIGENILGKAIRRLNRSRGRPTPTKTERNWLFSVIEDQVKEMEDLLGRSLSVWYPDGYK